MAKAQRDRARSFLIGFLIGKVGGNEKRCLTGGLGNNSLPARLVYHRLLSCHHAEGAALGRGFVEHDISDDVFAIHKHLHIL